VQNLFQTRMTGVPAAVSLFRSRPGSVRSVRIVITGLTSDHYDHYCRRVGPEIKGMYKRIDKLRKSGSNSGRYLSRRPVVLIASRRLILTAGDRFRPPRQFLFFSLFSKFHKKHTNF
jgi:hypothetical protein